MNEKSKIEMEELLSALVDDEATERQKNEFIRLVRHDPSIAEHLAVMQRQKQVLAALPVDSAPESLVEDVRSALERRQILGHTSGQTSVTGTAHLFMRRVLTAAAMFLLPIGLLSFVVYEIVKPPSDGPVGYTAAEKMTAAGGPVESPARSAPVTAKQLPFEGILTFQTDRLMAVSNYAEKVIFDQGLISFTVPHRTEDATTYQVTAPPEKITVLIDALKSVWPYCQRAALTVVDKTQNSSVDIPNIQTEQVKTLALEDSRDMLNRLAEQYASANAKRDSAFAMNEPPADFGNDLVDTSLLTIPIPTGRSQSPPRTIDPSQPVIRLQIHVERVEE